MLFRSYWNDTSNTIINNIENNYYGDDGISETDIVKLIEELLEKFNKENSDNPRDPGGDEPGGPCGDEPGGSGIEDFFDGFMKILDFLLSAIGKFLEVLGTFLSSALSLLSGLSGLTASFTGLLSELMPFMPQELWDIILAGVALSMIVVVVKAFRG